MADKYRIQRAVGGYGNSEPDWQDIRSEVKIFKNDKLILHLGKVKETQIKYEHEES